MLNPRTHAEAKYLTRTARQAWATQLDVVELLGQQLDSAPESPELINALAAADLKLAAHGLHHKLAAALYLNFCRPKYPRAPAKTVQEQLDAEAASIDRAEQDLPRRLTDPAHILLWRANGDNLETCLRADLQARREALAERVATAARQAALTPADRYASVVAVLAALSTELAEPTKRHRRRRKQARGTRVKGNPKR